MRTASIVLALILPLTTNAQDNLFTPQHIAKLRVVTEAVISPDGTQVAYVLSVPRDIPKEKDGPAWTELHVVDTMHQRKAMMNELSDAFIALPGGYGTLEEFFEILTWSQLGIHCKPSGLLNVSGYYDNLLAMLDHAVVEGFLLPANRKLVIADTDADLLVQRLDSLAAALPDKGANVLGNFL